MKTRANRNRPEIKQRLIDVAMKLDVAKTARTGLGCLALCTVLSACQTHAQPITALQPYKDGDNYQGFLLAYRNDGLMMHALVAIPADAHSDAALPVVIANHGFHPDPPQYGITTTGQDWRPGDYYRKVPGAFVDEGFVVVMPDYRGHSNSEGFKFTQSHRATEHYARDVLALLPLLDRIPCVNSDQLFMWGHSMGGEVTLQALLQTRRIKGASIWSTMGGSPWEQAYYYSRMDAELETHDIPTPDPVLQLKESANPPSVRADGNATQRLEKLTTPILIHHARHDASTLYAWSRRLAAQLTFLDKPHRFYTYSGSDHLFKDEQFEQALALDAEFFEMLQSKLLDAKGAGPN